MDNSKPILVVGATGYLGTEICKRLTDAKKNVHALVRPDTDHDKIKALKDLGITLVTGDLKNLSSIEAAVAGKGAIISTASSTISHREGDSIESVDRQGQLNLIEASGKAWVDQFIFVSFPESPETFPLQDAKREVEQRLIESNMNYTILRPGFFMEIWLGPHLGFDPANHKATIYGKGENPISWISVQDVAAFAVASLEHSSAVNSIIDIGGPEALSPLEVVKIFEETTGSTFELQFVPEEELRSQKEMTTDPLQRSFVSLMLTYAAGSPIEMNNTLQLIPISLHSVKEYSMQFVPEMHSFTEA